tara:strand:+ start:10294 stop:11232 length:939 start_codon:yes stop_codon:yes gene_type:complete
MNEKLMKLKPYYAQKVWGGDFLSRVKGRKKSDPIGELLEVSILKDSPSSYNDCPLYELFNENEITYCVKFIETTQNLSVQVHPGDEYAKEVENSRGKAECWLILEANPGEGIYLGLKDGVSKERFTEAIEKKEELNELMNFYPVKKGDFFFVPPGSIHAIGKGVLLLEVQQSCGVTYRVWDWNRLDLNGKPRELHIKKAMDVINFDPNFNTKRFFQYSDKGFSETHEYEMATHQDFSFKMVEGKKSEKIKVELNKRGRPTAIICLKGIVQIHRGNDSAKLSEYMTVLCPKGDQPDVMDLDVLSSECFLAVIH